MSTVRMGLVAVAFVGLMSIGVLANEPTESKKPAIGIVASEKKALTPDEEAFSEMISAPVGVFSQEYDEDGVLLRLKIKGEYKVTTALSGPSAERLAREQAERLAKAAFVKSLKEDFSYQDNTREETIFIEKDGQEQAAVKLNTTTITESQAKAVLRGLIPLLNHFEGEGRNRKAVVVFGWSKKLADAARTVQAEMARETTPVARPARGDKGGEAGSTGTKTYRAKNLTDF